MGIGHRHQCVLTIFQAKKSILHLLCRHEVVAIDNLLVILVNAGLDLVKFHIDVTGHNTLASSTTSFCFPKVRVAVHLATELTLCSIHCDAAHHRIGPILLQLLPLEVENHAVRTLHFYTNFTFNFQSAKLVNVEHPISMQIYSNFGNLYIRWFDF